MEEKLIKKEAKTQEKIKSKIKNQLLRRLAITNKQAKVEIDTFKDVVWTLQIRIMTQIQPQQ